MRWFSFFKDNGRNWYDILPIYTCWRSWNRLQIIIEKGAPLEWQGKRIKPVKLNCRRDMSNGRFA